jgi:PAS domain S-box-containing protein
MNIHHQPGAADGGAPVILVIDDDAEVRWATVRMLEAEGFQVLEGGTAAEAIELTGRHRPALVLLDVILPDGNGVELARQLKGDPALAGVFVILVSGMRTTPQEQAEGLVKGLADGYITRPFSKVEFLARVDAFLRIRHGEEALRESEGRYRSLFENNHAAMLIVDPDQGAIVDANPAACRFYGWTREQLQQMRINQINRLPPEQVQAEMDRARTHDHHFLFPHRLADGSLRDVEVFSGPVMFGGRPLLYSIVHDITERKRAEKALEQAKEEIVRAERHYRVIFNSVSDAVFVFTLGEDGLPGPFLEVNDSACRYLGYTREELLGMRFFDIVDPGLNEDLPGLLQILRANGQVLYEGNDRAKNGCRIPVEINTSLADLYGPRTLISSVRDISDRKDAERKYRDIFEGAIEGIYRTSSEGVSQTANPALAKMLGYESTEEFLSVQTDSAQVVWLDPNDRLRFLQQLDKDEVIRGYECQLKRKDGTGIWVSLNSRRICGQDGRILYNEGFIEDITERKRAAEEKAKLEAQFHQAQKMESIGRLAGGVAHDFNNLLTVINGYSQMLLTRLSADDPMREDLTEIHTAGERAAGLTRQLLAFSRKQVLEPRRLDINQVVEEMRPMLERLMGEDIEVRVALHAEGGTIHADPHQLGQVVMNLAVNSRDAMPGGGKLLIETARVERDASYTRLHPEAREGCYVILAVSDTGAGMDAETKNRIFEPFFTTKGVGKGTGLGLAMVQGIVAQSGGYVEVSSEKGRGTTFQIYLPALVEAAADWKPIAAPALGGKETVLVVEDQAEVRKYVAAVLKAYGYRVIPAEGASEALLLREREHIDLVLTDVVMPHVSGRELANRLKTLQPDIKVLFMSGYTDSVIEQHGILEDGTMFIQKPFGPEELAGKVRAVLGRPEVEQPEAEQPAIEHPVRGSAVRILVADDEGGVRGFLRSVLETGGYDVIEAADGRQALRHARAGHVDLVVTDLVMPELEGLETIRALRRDMPGVGIIAISGAFEGQFLETARLLGANAVLNKPVSAELLLAKVAQLLRPQQ